MSQCEVVEVRNSADAVGLACLKTTSKQCSDCGAELCESHAETCGMCSAVFCPPCLTFHQQHPKVASADRGTSRERRTA
jgi:predicted sulfurtransferase